MVEVLTIVGWSIGGGILIVLYVAYCFPNFWKRYERGVYAVRDEFKKDLAAKREELAEKAERARETRVAVPVRRVRHHTSENPILGAAVGAAAFASIVSDVGDDDEDDVDGDATLDDDRHDFSIE